MPIDALEAFRVRLPLPEPLRVWGRVIDAREFVFVRVRSGAITGTGFALTRGMPLDQIVERQLKPFVSGRALHETRRIWDNALASVRMIGASGMFMRALSLVDLAMWDAYAKSLDAPLWQLWGGAARTVPCLAICGYYRPGVQGDWGAESLQAVQREAEALGAAGYTHFKIPAGEDRALDLARIRLLRAIAGPDAQIGVDVSGVFDTAKDALDAIDALAAAGVDFFEDPFPANAPDLARALSSQTRMRIAYGESITSLETMQALCTPGGVDLPRPDATVLGGATGFMQAIAPALAPRVPIFPHYYPDLHAPLAAGLGLALIEESPPQADTVGFGALRATQPRIEQGLWHVNDRAGFGIDWDEDAIRAHTVAH